MKAEEIGLGKTYLRGDGAVLHVVGIVDNGSGAIVTARGRPQDSTAEEWPWSLGGPIGPFAESLAQEVSRDWLHPDTAEQHQAMRRVQKQKAAEEAAVREQQRAADLAAKKAEAEEAQKRAEAEAARQAERLKELHAAEDQVARLQSELVLAQHRLSRAQRG